MNKLKSICPLFINISDKDLKKIEEKLFLRNFRNKEVILREGNENNNIYIIRSGVVRVDTYSNNKKQTLSFLKEGDFFGEITVFTGGEISANVMSMVNSEVYTLKKDDLEKLLIDIPQLSLNIIQYLAIRVRTADKVIYDYAFKMLESRVASKLLGLMAMFKGKDAAKNFINLPITHQDLADYVGTSRETVTKILAKFRDRGILEIQTKKITILDEKRLTTWGED
jgi:CRP/FNR family transcriptional regulator